MPWCSFVSARRAEAHAAEVVNTASVSFVGLAGPVTLPTNPVRTVSADAGRRLHFRSENRFTRYRRNRRFRGLHHDHQKRRGLQFSRPIELDDQLPFGFSYENGKRSARNGVKLPDPAGGSGPDLTFPLGTLDPGQTRHDQLTERASESMQITVMASIAPRRAHTRPADHQEQHGDCSGSRARRNIFHSRHHLRKSLCRHRWQPHPGRQRTRHSRSPALSRGWLLRHHRRPKENIRSTESPPALTS